MMEKRNITYPLNTTQQEMYEEWNEDRNMTQYNISDYVLFPSEKASAQRLAEGAQRLLDGQRYLHAHLVEQGDEVLICEDWSMPNRVHRLTMSDAEWQADKERIIVRPFDLFHEPPVRIYVISTETSNIIVTVKHHLFFDGVSIKSLWMALGEVINGEEPFQSDDSAAEFVRRSTDDYDSEPYRRGQQYYQEHYAGVAITDICRKADSPLGNTLVSRPRVQAAPIDDCAQRMGLSMPVVFHAAYALALGRMAGEQRVVFFSTNHGRDRRLSRRAYGNYLNSLPVMIDTRPEQTVGELLRQTKTQLFTAMRHKTYPVLHMLRDLNIGLDDNGTELTPWGTAVIPQLTVDRITYPIISIESGLTLEHLCVLIIVRGDQYEVAADGSDALYTQQQIDTAARLIGEYALKLSTANEDDTIGSLNIEH